MKLEKNQMILPTGGKIFFVLFITAMAGYIAVYSEYPFLIPMLCMLCVIAAARFSRSSFCSLAVCTAGTVMSYFTFERIYSDSELCIATAASFAVMAAAAAFIRSSESEYRKLREISERKSISSYMLRAISHDIRNPLTVILGAVSAVIENRSGIDEDTLMELMADVRSEAERLKNMTENVLTVSMIAEETGKLSISAESAEEIVRDSVKALRLSGETVVETVVPAKSLTVMVNAVLIKQVMINIMENSIIHGCATRIILSAEIINNEVLFRICDNGKGISKSFINMLNEGVPVSESKYYRQKDSNLGISMSVCKKIVDMHGGAFSAGNNKDGGAEFSFTVPLKANE